MQIEFMTKLFWIIMSVDLIIAKLLQIIIDKKENICSNKRQLK
jgi:hypothetical protein